MQPGDCIVHTSEGGFCASGTLMLRMSWSNICTRMACVLGSCTSSHLSSFHAGFSVFF